MRKIYSWFQERLEIQLITEDVTSKYVPPHLYWRNNIYLLSNSNYNGICYNILLSSKCNRCFLFYSIYHNRSKFWVANSFDSSLVCQSNSYNNNFSYSSSISNRWVQTSSRTYMDYRSYYIYVYSLVWSYRIFASMGPSRLLGNKNCDWSSRCNSNYCSYLCKYVSW